MRYTKRVKRVGRRAPHLAKCGSVSISLTQALILLNISCGPMSQTWTTTIGSVTSPIVRVESASRCTVVEEVFKEVGRSVIAVGRNHMESVADAQVIYRRWHLLWLLRWHQHWLRLQHRQRLHLPHRQWLRLSHRQQDQLMKKCTAIRERFNLSRMCRSCTSTLWKKCILKWTSQCTRY